MTEDRSPLIGLVLADDAEFFELLRGIPKSECNRCRTGEHVTAGEVGGEGRQEMRCGRCDFGWSVVADGDPS